MTMVMTGLPVKTEPGCFGICAHGKIIPCLHVCSTCMHVRVARREALQKQNLRSETTRGRNLYYNDLFPEIPYTVASHFQGGAWWSEYGNRRCLHDVSRHGVKILVLEWKKAWIILPNRRLFTPGSEVRSLESVGRG